MENNRQCADIRYIIIMNFEEVNDDLGTAKPFRVVAAVAVHGRLPLLEHTINRLYKNNGCYKVVCSGDGLEEKNLCQSLGAVWTPRRNKPLGMKWNAAFQKARDFHPDAIVFVGSSDWLSDNWFSLMRPYVEQHGFAGVPGCYLADLGKQIRAVDWTCGYAGYRQERADECIGIGRMLSRRLLDAIDWTPFDPKLDNSLDRSMKDRSIAKGYHDFMVKDERLKALSLSCPYWDNKHKFWMHWGLDVGEQIKEFIPSIRMKEPDHWLSENFPEAIELHKKLTELNLPYHRENSARIRQ